MDITCDNRSESICDIEKNEQGIAMLKFQPSEPERIDFQIMDSPSRSTPSKTSCRIVCTICVLLAGAVVISALEIYRLKRHSNQGPSASEGVNQPQALITFDSASQEFSMTKNSKEIDLRISPDSSKCPSKHCSTCQTRIPKARPPLLKTRHCRDNHYAFRLMDAGCGGSDYEWVTAHVTDDDLLECEYDVVVTCCMLAALMPPDKCNGTPVCSRSSKPECQCELGKTNPPLCQDSDDELVVCDCYNETLKLCGEESMPECSNTGRPADWSVCHIGGQTAGQNCVCKPARSSSEGPDLKGIESCVMENYFQRDTDYG